MVGGPLLAYRFESINEVGRSSNAVVERALDHVTGSIVTVKRGVERDTDARLKREFELLSSLGHPNIVTAIDCSPRSPSRTIRTFSSEEYCFRVARRMDLTCSSALSFLLIVALL